LISGSTLPAFGLRLQRESSCKESALRRMDGRIFRFTPCAAVVRIDNVSRNVQARAGAELAAAIAVRPGT
jgi:hypothetical protein